MKKIGILTVLFLSGLLSTYAQQQIDGQDILKGYNTLPKEYVYLHYNGSLLFTGEHLYYKMYCLESKAQNLSGLSKIGYVELVGKEGLSVFKQKIRLQSGVGTGDVLIPTNIPSGSYKLLGYTQWMQNDGLDYFFKADINIINPYQVTEAVFPEKTTDSMSVPSKVVEAVPLFGNQGNISLSVNGKTFQKRDLVSLTITGTRESLNEGAYSVSVRRKATIAQPRILDFESFPSLYMNNTSGVMASGSQNEMYLPELRGELLSGKVVDKATNEPVANIVVTLSLTGRDFIFETAKTNGNGMFYFNLDDTYPNENALVQLLSTDKEKFNVVLDEQYKANANAIEFNTWTMDKDMKDFILEQSIYNQIENAYADIKQNKNSDGNPLVPFYRKYDEVYNLDDYTRFSTIEETLVEIIDHVWLNKDENGDPVLQVRPPLDKPESNLPPLVLMDGLFIQHHKDIMGYNARKIKTINFSRDKYLMGSHTFQGIVSIVTMNGDFYETLYRDYIKTVSLHKPLSQKEYYRPIYDGKTEAGRIPDFRSQLLWQPNVEISENGGMVQFYTSDVPGDYEIYVEGITKSGHPISAREIVHVE